MSQTVDLPADEQSALIVGPSVLAAPIASGSLDGLTFVAKDVIDVAGQRTGAGNPDLLAAAVPATANAWAVERLLAAGATCIGKAHTVETAYAMSGVNDHYGTPTNPAAPGRDPGGSSSGSAVAVAAGLSDFALGTDTAGSVRVPASYCGIIGFRPTHGRVSVDGVFPLAPRLDTVGWFARTGAVARSVGEVLLARSRSASAPQQPSRLLVATDLFGQCDPDHFEEIGAAMDRIATVARLSVEPVRFWGEGEREQWPEVFRTIQRFDAWRTHRAWIESERPRFGPSVAPRWEEAAAVTADQNAAAEGSAAALSGPAWELLSGGSVLIVPSAPGPAPRLKQPDAAATATRARLMSLSVIAPILGAPEVSLPLLRFDDLPVGIGLMASPGCDEMLLDLAARLV